MQYDESLFDEVNIEGINDWHFEQNQDKAHEMYGKFVIYTMEEGVTENEDIAELTLKLKDDLKPQKTEVKFTRLQSSDGEVSVDEDDREAVIEVYEEPQTPPQTLPTPEEPQVIPESPKTPIKPEEPINTEGPKDDVTFSVKTGDSIIIISVILAIAVIALNIMVILKNKESKQNGKGVKIGIITSISIIALGLVMLGITSLAHNNEITELINKLNYKEQWLNSEKYLVTDESVSRIAPLTDIGDITDKFNKEIEVYEKNSDEKVVDGLVKSGMTIFDKEHNYNISVLGDINGDGESNHVELTTIIRHIVDSEKYKFNDLEELSADMNVNQTVDQEDIHTSIRYILYGELDIPEFEQVKEPKIEVVGGTFNNKIDAYEDTIQVKITEQDENAVKTKYKIEGTEEKPYVEIESGKIIDLPNNGVYKISAYSYGKLGNRSEIPYEILLKKNPNNKYKVVIRTEKEDGTYEESVEEREGRIGETVTIDDEIPDGYEINEEESTITGEIPEEEIIELVVTYDRKEYTLTLESSDYISSVKLGDETNTTVSKKIKFGKTVDISAEVENKEGYTTTFDRWASSNKDLIADNAEKDTTIKMPKSDITLTAMANRVSNKDTQYTVEYYYQKDGTYKTTADSSKQKNGETDSKVVVDDIDKTPTKEGYVFDDAKLDQLSGIVKGDGSTVLKVYFKQQFKVTYLPGTHGTFEAQTTEGLDYGTTTPAFLGELTHEAGYRFVSWDKNVENTVTNTSEYTAIWESEVYHISYDLDGGTLGVDENGQQITNKTEYTVETESFTLNNPTKTGYTFKGWTGTDLKETNESGEIVDKLTDHVTIEKGSTGDRAYTANWQENTGVPYHVKYYLEKLESTDANDKNNYKLEQDVELSGTTNEEKTAEIKEYKGFTYDENNPNNVKTGNVAGDGSLVLEVYYKRNSYTLLLQKDENIEDVTGKSVEKNIGISLDNETKTALFKFEQPVEIEATLKNVEGYQVTFKTWETTNTTVLTTQEERKSQKATFIMPAEDVTAKATSNIEPNTVEYTVEYYYEGEDGYPETPTYTNTEPRSGKVGETVAVTDADKVPDSTKLGYEFDEEAQNVLSKTIPTTGTVTLKVYFKKTIYTLNIVAGEGISRIQLGEQSANETLTNTYKYGDSITINADCEETEEGYTIEFGKWKSSSQALMADSTTQNLTFTMPAGDLTLTAEANKIALDASYNIEYYYQKDGKYPEEPKNVITRQGKTGEQASITPADKMPITEGYVYDNDAEGKVESTGEEGIKPDGSTTLKVFFKQQFTVTYEPGEHGAFEAKVIENLDYGADVPEYTGSLDGNGGYVFDRWKLTKIDGEDVTDETEDTEGSETTDEEARKVTANLEYTAQWKPMPVPTVTHSPTEWTNQNVVVNITAPEQGYSIEYRLDESTDWIEYTEEFEVEQNGIVYARLAKDSNKGQEVEHEITNIDKIKPEFGEKSVNTEKNDEAIIVVKATDNLSGIVEYGITKEEYAGQRTYKCERTLSTELTFNEIYENGIYKLYLKDAGGNINEDTIEITNIKGFNVARIVDAPEEYKYLIGQEYETLALALEASDEAAQLGNVKIEIIHNIYNESNTIKNGRNYTIDLNNFYIKNQEAEATLTVEGKLQIVDGNKLGTGTVSSPFGVGIYITKQGELTLGEDEGGTPSTFSPIIEGLTYGIQKEIDKNANQVYDEDTEKYYYPEGVFNFYDGKIIGGTGAFLEQRVNDTPALYDPTVVTNPETNNQESTLAIVSGIEAVIGKKRYMLLEEAIEDANNVIGNPSEQVEITIVKDLAKDAEHKIIVDKTKNIKLDLNGHVFTTTANDYVLENYGKLEIYNSKEPVDYLYSINAADANIVSGNKNGTSVGYTKDVNFNFTIEEEASYELYIKGGYMNRACKVILDEVEIYNLANCTSTSEATIQLNNLSAGGHTIRLYSGNEYGPDYNTFTIRPSEKSSGKIVGSTNTTILNGITEETIKDIEYENIDLSNAKHAGEYYFETRAEGGLVSGNTGIDNSTSHSLLELDLTEKEGIYEVVINTIISSESSDIGYVTVRKDDKIVEYSDSNGRKVYTKGSASEEHKFDLAGGCKYYIQFGYYKNRSVSTDNDCFIIKDMKYRKKEAVGSLTITSGTFECEKKGTNSFTDYTAVIQNEGNLYINGGNIKTTKEYCMGIYNGKSQNVAYAEINGGKINTYYISTLNRGFSKINNGTLNSSSNACVWNDGALYILGEDVDIRGYSGVYTNNSGNTIINNGTIFGTNYGIYNYGNDSTTRIKGGNVSSNNYAIYNESSGNINIENVNITSANTGVYNRSSGTIQINNIQMASVKSSGAPTVEYGLYNNSNGKIIFNDGEIYTDRNAMENMTSGTLEINGGTIKTYSNYITIVNSSGSSSSVGTVKITNGTIIGSAKSNVIYNSYKGNIIVTGGTIESESTEYPIIWNADTEGVVTIGTDDTDVSTESPVIKCAGTNAVNNKLGTFNFYDGVLIGLKDAVIGGILTKIPEQSEIVKEVKDDGLEHVTLGMPTNCVARIAQSDNPDVSKLDKSYYKIENGYYNFVTLNSAVEACNTSNTTTIELVDNPWVYRTVTIDEGQDIKINVNNKTMYLHATLNFENNGKISFTNDNEENVGEEERAYGNITANGGLLIKNNENAQMKLDNISISYKSSQGSNNNRRKIIDNHGKLDISNCKYDVYYNSSNSYMYVYDIYNEETGMLNINNTTISGNGQYQIASEGKDTKDGENTTYSVVINNSTLTHTGNPYGILNNGEGTILVEGSTLSSYYENSNSSSGNIIMRNSTISSNNYFYNKSTGHVEIDNSTINGTTYNQSSGSILIKGENSNLKNIVNSNTKGTVEIQAGTVSYTSNTINNSGILIISGGNITATSTSSDGNAIYNNSGADAVISGTDTTVTGNGRGITNIGKLTIKSGKITGAKSQGIYNTGNLTLGEKDGNIKFSPVINGGTDGVYNTGTFNFYDGIIEGNETKSITGVIPSETEEDCLRVIHEGEYEFDDGTQEKYSVASGREISVLEKVDIAYVVSKQKYYSTLQSALEDTENTDTIEIIHDVSISGTVPSLTIPENKDITLDLKGFNIVAGNNKTIINEGTFEIKDSTSHEDEDGNIIEGTFVNGANTILENKGTATIENGSYELTIGGNSSNYYNMFTNTGTGTLTLNSKGTYKAKGTYSRIIYNTTGNVTINNGKLEATQSYSTAIWNDTGTITIKTASVKGSEYSIYNNGSGKINIESGTIENNMYNKANGTVNISGGNINNYVRNAGEGIINISGGALKYSSSSSVVDNTSNGTINITGGSITGGSTGVSNNTGTINIDGTKLDDENRIKISGSYSGSTYGINNRSSGTVNIKGFVDISASTGSSYTAYGVYNEATGTINVGNPEDITNDVKISSTNYGLFNYTNSRGTINYYGGKITAPISVRGYIKEIPEGYEIVKSVNEANKEVYEIGNVEKAVSVGGATYDTLEEAISSNESGTITLLKDLVLTTSQNQIIDQNKNLILDLNGHEIKLHNYGVGITNNGTLKITDNTEEKKGRIYGYAETAIKNYGDFEMAGGSIEIDQTENQKMIHNVENGKIKITGGTLKNIARTIESTYYNIYNESEQDLTITGGTIYTYKQLHSYRWDWDSTVYAVYCTQKINVDMTGGIIETRKGSDNTANGFYMAEGGTLNISGSAELKSETNINLNNGGQINISENADLSNSVYSIYTNYSGKENLEINISGGKVKNIYANVNTNCTSTVELEGGNVIGTISYCDTVDVYNGVNFNTTGDALSSCTNVNIHEGATVTSTGTAISSCTTVNIDNATIEGMVNSPTTLNMTGGSITGKSYGIQLNSKSAVATITGGTINATAGPGILITTGTLVLGEDDEDYPNAEEPAITGSTYGVQNNGGTFNFYDGILTGSTHATNGEVTETPEMFNVIYRADGTVAILGVEATFEQVAKVNGVFYDDLTSAIEAAIDVNGQVDLCKDITTSKEIIIPEENTITIDLLGYSINGYTESEALFTNNGTLTIKDSTNEGTNQSTVRNYTGIAIVNNGELKIGEDDSIVHTNAPKIIGKTIAIENNKDLYFYDGQIGISDETGDIVTNKEKIHIPDGYKLVKSEGTNTYTLAEE